MNIANAIKMTLRFRQAPMSIHQIAYFICFNHLLQDTSSFEDLVQAVEEAVRQHPGYFNVSNDLVHMSNWQQNEQQIVEQVFSTVQQAIGLFRELDASTDTCNNMVLALVLYKRLSDIERSQQLGAPIVPYLWKFDRVTHDTMLSELSVRVHEVMDYIERTDERLAHTFLFGKLELNRMNEPLQLKKLQEVMRLLATLQLDEEQVPTKLFQVIFSQLFRNNLHNTSRKLSAEV
ncbi:hypothetical protein K3G39_01710 [Pontibacter sp. HSC-14F20]|uniref:hypothetical protein n=1 Tax=Pontibacter sp. HSC-14F20 TaxID=2864136 RepID=UPI001C733D80|nr:hypothetical protein [Pontibacter sp. HSC-14F20]MBX0331947.1 hypothetical protein [Pontibacter sp. HSC-14F20]